MPTKNPLHSTWNLRHLLIPEIFTAVSPAVLTVNNLLGMNFCHCDFSLACLREAWTQMVRPGECEGKGLRGGHPRIEQPRLSQSAASRVAPVEGGRSQPSCPGSSERTFLSLQGRMALKCACEPAWVLFSLLCLQPRHGLREWQPHHAHPLRRAVQDTHPWRLQGHSGQYRGLAASFLPNSLLIPHRWPFGPGKSVPNHWLLCQQGSPLFHWCRLGGLLLSRGQCGCSCLTQTRVLSAEFLSFLLHCLIHHL